MEKLSERDEEVYYWETTHADGRVHAMRLSAATCLRCTTACEALQVLQAFTEEHNLLISTCCTEAAKIASARIVKRAEVTVCRYTAR